MSNMSEHFNYDAFSLFSSFIVFLLKIKNDTVCSKINE